MKIEILQDTPFDKKGTILSIKDFRLKYSYICTKDVCDSELFDYINMFTLNPNSTIDLWFRTIVIVNPISKVLEAIIDGILYVKDFDGLYHGYIVGNEIKRENSISMLSINQFEKLITESKFTKPIWYCTNNVNKKL